MVNRNTKNLKIGFLLLTFFFFFFFILLQNQTHEKEDFTKNDIERLNNIVREIEGENDLDVLIEKTKDKDFVLLGESSHGTLEYYEWRGKITKRLIKENNYAYIVVEGDWPNIHNVNKYVKSLDNSIKSPEQALLINQRWPEWMWYNQEFIKLVEWLRKYNEELPIEEKVGLYGMDMQNLDGAINETKEYIKTLEINLINCLKEEDIISCKDKIDNVMNSFNKKYSSDDVFNSEELFNLKQNLLLIKYSEKHFNSQNNSWNIRVEYMNKTVENLSEKYGKNSKGIIWAHNTHIGDARATEMANSQMVNLGQLLRENYHQENIFLLGFGTYTGELLSSLSWEGSVQKTSLPKAKKNTLEDFLNKVNMNSFIFFLDTNDLPKVFSEYIGHRAKGVVYNPDNDNNHYVESILKNRYDGFIFIKETNVLNKL